MSPISLPRCICGCFLPSFLAVLAVFGPSGAKFWILWAAFWVHILTHG